ncbi:uncharacterized protein LOC111089657 [Limulus polyphemus]|uniref:Uncharacterized protein LOC111089657 n=1 Tax=Limulus polyphemus TaxID=6850 RepID=A0ABM1TQV0_LIMPO|nr:uncharacterized protein LOC111089657 [Limulus polyphemus]
MKYNKLRRIKKQSTMSTDVVLCIFLLIGYIYQVNGRPKDLHKVKDIGYLQYSDPDVEEDIFASVPEFVSDYYKSEVLLNDDAFNRISLNDEIMKELSLDDQVLNAMPLPSKVLDNNAKVDSTTSSFRNFILGFMEEFRQVLLTGLSGLKIPVLDPMVIPNQLYNYNGETVQLQLQFENINIIGISKFRLEKLNTNVEKLPLKINFTLNIHSLIVKTKCSGKGTFASFIPVSFENINVNIKVEKVEVIGSVELMMLNKKLKATGVDLDVQFGMLQMDFEGLDTAEIYSDIIETLQQPVIEEFKPSVLGILKENFFKLLNVRMTEFEPSRYESVPSVMN